MAENIINSGEQRQFSGGYGGNSAGGNSVACRKKANNGGGGGDLTASPKYNKSNSRAYNRDVQQQKQYRGNNQNNRAQRGGGNSRYRNNEQHSGNRDENTDVFDYVGVEEDNFDENSEGIFEFDDQYSNKRGGSSAKKTNMSHLLNFHYLDKQRVNVRGNRRSSNSNYYSNNRSLSGSSYRQSFSKEQFLQANCQFIVRTDSIDYSVHFADPDLAIDWTRVEQVRLHSMQALKCPICLSEPQAGKITRCGHVYCWSCLLHYLALSDKPWRKCPVCSESIYKQDIRSVRGMISRSLKPGDWITFRLMCRERGSVLFYPKNSPANRAPSHPEPERLNSQTNRPQFAHLLSADDQTILNEMIEIEKVELLQQLEEEGDQPEACFIKQALEENSEREKQILERTDKIKHDEGTKVTPKQPKEVEEKLLPTKSQVVYDNAFDDVIESTVEEKPEVTIEEKPEVNVAAAVEKNPPSSASTGPPTRHYFYQADDIYHAYLNGFNTRILLHEYGYYQNCPDELHVRVEAVESYFMTEDLRSQFRSLSHLPLTCEFQVIEVRLHPPVISPATAQAFTEEIHRRRQFRTRKERLEKRRQQQAEFVESQKLFSQYPPEMMYIPQESFPVNGTNSMEEFPAMIGSATSSSPPSASVQLSDENCSPPSGVSFAQMLKQQAPPQAARPWPVNKPNPEKSSTIEISTRTKKNKKKKGNNDSEEEFLNEDEEYYSSVPNFHSSFSLEEVFDRLKLVNGEEHPATTLGEPTATAANASTTKKKNKKNKQVLFATGLGGQAKL